MSSKEIYLDQMSSFTFWLLPLLIFLAPTVQNVSNCNAWLKSAEVYHMVQFGDVKMGAHYLEVAFDILYYIFTKYFKKIYSGHEKYIAKWL